jgi:hypothetical protein
MLCTYGNNNQCGNRKNIKNFIHEKDNFGKEILSKEKLLNEVAQPITPLSWKK